MAEIKANDVTIKQCGDNIISLADEYNKAINDLFDSLEKLNKGAWAGGSADTYVGLLAKDKKQFLNHGEYIKMYGKVIKNTGDNVDRIITKWEDKAQNV